MSRQLYEEALAEVKQLKQLAEDNAKRAVLDEVAPRIKQLIEQNLSSVDDNFVEETPTRRVEHKISSGAKSMLSEVIGRGPHTKESIATAVKFFNVMHPNLSDISHGTQVAQVIEGLYVIASNNLTQKEFSDLEPVLESCYRRVKKQLIELKAISLKEAALNLKIDGFSNETLDSDTLDKLTIEIVPEIEGAEASGEATSEEVGETPEVEGAESAETISSEPPAEGEAPAESPGAETTPEEETPEEPVKKEGKNMDKFAMLSDDTVVEIDEGMLRREIARMKALREAKEGMPKASKNAPKGHGVKGTEKHFGGGKDEGEAFVDGDVTTADDLTETWHAMDEDDVLEVVADSNKDDDLEEKAMHSDEEGADELDEIVKELEDMDEKQMHSDEEHSEEDSEEESEEELEEKKAVHSDEEGSEEDSEEDLDEYSVDEADMDEGPTKKVPSEMKAHPAAQSNRQPNLPESRNLASLIEARKKAAKVAQAAKAAKNESVFNKAVSVYNKATASIKALQESNVSSNSDANQEVETLRNQLAETNLFNAKLLYTNKLLQNESLSARQKVAVIEKLDEARSLREAKLVYESLTRTIASGKASVNENADRQVLGSASRATRPSSTVSLNEGVETSRWARLAGITK